MFEDQFWGIWKSKKVDGNMLSSIACLYWNLLELGAGKGGCRSEDEEWAAGGVLRIIGGSIEIHEAGSLYKL